jgi:hypothetical protein
MSTSEALTTWRQRGCFDLDQEGSDTRQLHWRDWMQLYSVLSCSYNAGFWIALKRYDGQRKDGR